MNKLIKRCAFLLVLLIPLSWTACTDLSENVYHDIIANNFYNNRREVLQAVLRPYTHLQACMAPTGQNAFYYMSELSADQLAWPQKGRNGYDGGDHIRQHYHTWTTQESRIEGSWNLFWAGIGFCNTAIQQLEDLNYEALDMTEDDINSLLAELHVERAFYYMNAMDLWGNIPIITKVADPKNPPTETRKKVFEFIQKELEDNVPLLQPLSQEMDGRFSQAAGYAMLAELYLNAEVWHGTPMWDKCIAACDKIISGQAGAFNGTMELDKDLEITYSNQNRKSKESIAAFAFSRKGGFSFDWGGFFMGYSNMSKALNVGYSGWNAFVVIPSAFDMFQENDLRKKEWFLFGPQYVYGTHEPILGTEEWANKPLVYVNSIRLESQGDTTSAGSMTEGEENSGARFNKYKSGTLDDPNYLENEYILYRLTEIYFDKAEAIMRKNGGKATQEAVDLINASRKRAFTKADWPDEKYTTATLTMDELLAERGREFIFEGKRRTDLIRFGKFTTASWWDHKPLNDPNKTLFPIPHKQIAINPNLKQNPGYGSQ